MANHDDRTLLSADEALAIIQSHFDMAWLRRSCDLGLIPHEEREEGGRYRFDLLELREWLKTFEKVANPRKVNDLFFALRKQQG